MSIFFKKSAFGLDVSDHSIEALELSSKSKVKAFARIVLEPGIVKNGMILDKKKLAEKIKGVVSQAKIESNQVVLSLPESKVFIHIFQVPKGLKGKALKDAIAFEAPKIIPLEQENIYWDYQTISSLPKSAQKSVLYIATFKEIIDGYIEVLNKVGLKPVVFEIESIALGRALLQEIKLKNSLMIVDIGARTTNISIFNKNKELRWSSSIAVAGGQFTKAISEKLKVSLDQAEKIKRKQGLAETSKTVSILQKELQVIIQEIKKTLLYYKEKIDEVLLVGGSAQMPNLVSYFSLNIERKVSLGKSLITKQLRGNSILYNPVIGLALRALGRGLEKAGINLFPQKARKEISLISKEARENKYFQIFGYIFPLVALAFLGWAIMKYTPKGPMPRYAIIKVSVKQELEPQPEAGPPQVKEQQEIVPEEKIVQEEAVPEEEEELVEEKIIKVVVQAKISRLDVRKGPGTSYPIIAKVYPGEVYQLLQEQDEWYKINIDEQTQGWVFARYVSKEE